MIHGVKKWFPFLGMGLMLIFSGGAAFTQELEGNLLKDFRWRNIGPSNMQGRVTDIEALDSDYRRVLVASASGGVWKSDNAGTTWESIFDDAGSASIGDIAVFQKDPRIIWVGTGESCTRNSVGWGDGVYKSTDGGKTFTNMGLPESRHIGEVVIHPDNPDIVYVAAQGRLWGYNPERGLYKTTDGGKHWTRLEGGLPADGKTGCTDVKLDPNNPEILYAAFWERIRRPWRFDSGGPNGGIFKSTDGGKSWKKLTRGLPQGDTGKIGLAVYRKNPKIIMAVIEHGYHPNRRREPEAYNDMTKLGSGVYRSEDGGQSWNYVNRTNNRPFYYSHIYLNPNDDQKVYLLTGSAMISEDGGKNFRNGMPGISGDFHAMWLDPQDKDRFYVGNDKGTSLTQDHGRHFTYFDNMAIGQFYAVTYDLRDPYYVYGGLQDNGIWGGPSNSRNSSGILTDHWFKFHSGDGFHVQVDPTDWTTVYSESQGGAIRRNHALFRQQTSRIRPNRENVLNLDEELVEQSEKANGRLFRNNWSTPFILSPHNPHTLYYGAQVLLKSVNRGDSWKIISPDLSTGDPERTNPESGGLTRDVTGAETNATIITISESPLRPGLVWVGTDDGRVHVTRNDGVDWTEVTRNIPGLPSGLWISRVRSSHHDAETAYVTVDGHRSDDFHPYVFKTTDLGKTWKNITGNIPEGHSVYVITEDRKNPNLLFVGTEFSVFVSINDGRSWNRLANGLPTVAIHDLVIHPRENDLIAATHGRSLWILDDLSPLQQLDSAVLDADRFLFQQSRATLWKGISRGAARGHQVFQGRNPFTIAQRPPANSPPQLQDSAAISYYLKSDSPGDVMMEISEISGENRRQLKVPGSAGIHKFYWDLRFNPSPLQKALFQLTQDLRNATLDEDRRKILEAAKSNLPGLAKNDEERDRMRQRIRTFERALQSGFGFRFGGRLQGRRRGPVGSPAKPGLYRVKLTAGENTLATTLTIREDPLFEKMVSSKQ